MMIGTLVRFNHERNGGPVHRVNAVSGALSGGMISLDDIDGWFAPHLFEEATDIAGVPLDGARVETEIERLTSELKRVKALCAQMADQGVYSDSYGVHGSDFQCCKCCTAGGAPGVPFEHDAKCPVGRSEETVNEWFSEMKENAAGIDRLRREKAELVEVVKDMLSGLAYLREHDCVPYGLGIDRLEESGRVALGSDPAASNTEQG